MSRRTEIAASTKSVELVKQEDHLEFDDPDEEDEEEEVEYEEIEEEVEYEEVEEEEEEEEEEEKSEVACEGDAKHDSKMVDVYQKDEDEKEKHAELLALPPHGSEVYVGGISSDISSEDLKNLFESVGEVVEVRIRGKGDNKLYAFVNFRDKELALKAIQKLNNKDLKVKSLYVKNLPKTVTEEQLKKLFEHLGEITKVILPPAKAGHENRYGFVHFKERYMAIKALKNTERYELDGQLLDCSLAKADKKDGTVSVPTVKGGPLLPSYTPLGYGLAGANPLGNGLAGANPLGNGLAGVYNPMVLPDGRLVYVPQPAGQQIVHLASPPAQQGGRRYGGSGSRCGGSSSGGKRQRGDDRGSNSNNSRRGRHRPS